MPQSSSPSSLFVLVEVRELFHQRTLLCLWLAVVFFPLFAILDRIYCPELFTTFLLWRLLYVICLLAFINILKLLPFKQLTGYLMYASMQLGCFVISLMTVELGGFTSGYYAGILLMIAGALSVLPLTAANAAFYGLSMYVVYIMTVLVGTDWQVADQLAGLALNSFFFLCVVAIAAVQSHDDLGTLQQQLRAMESIRRLRTRLAAYTDDLEETIKTRLIELQETDLRYQELYENILDMVVLVDEEGVIHQGNSNAATTLGCTIDELKGQNIRDFLRHARERTDWLTHVMLHLGIGSRIRGIPLNLHTYRNTRLEVELSASQVRLENTIFYQLVLRDITATRSMERKLLDAERQVGSSRQAAIFGLARLAECRDSDTGQHLIRIRHYTRILAEELSHTSIYAPIISEQFIEDIGYSAVLHDIGKVGIADSILMKPGKLTTGEYEEMKKHTTLGADVLANADQQGANLTFLQLGREIARSHHERWDASGYPDGLQGQEIPLAARIIALADVYDALTSSRVYKPPYSHEEARSMILEESGRQFDPDVVNAFLRRENDFRETRMRHLLQQNSSPETSP